MRTISKIKTAAAALVLALGLGSAAQAQGVSVFVDGQRVGFDQPPIIRDGRTLVPLRGVFEQMGATVVWNAGSRTVSANSGSTQVSLPIGSRYAIVDGQQLTLDVPAMIVGGRTLVPLRFIAESLGADVDWNAASRTVVIASSGGDVGGGDVNPPPTAQRPDIDSVVVSPQRVLRGGDTLRVIMTGDAGGQATFDIVGFRTGIPMSEVSSGRYEGTLNITDDMDVDNAALVVHLTRNNLTATSSASTSISFEGTAGLLSRIDLQPNAPYRVGQNVVVTAYGAANSTATMDVGGRYNIPMSQVSSGIYRGQFVVQGNDRDSQVTVHLRAPDGRTITQVAEETIAFETNGSIYLNLISPTNGQSVTGQFNIQGQTVPYASVDITATPVRELIGGIIGLPAGGSISRTVQADANGNFALSIDTSNLDKDLRLQVSVIARDQYGNTSSDELEVAID